jgi:hypothetical protein
MKRMVGIDVGSYTFDASAKTVTISGITSLLLNQFLLITNTTDNIIIYNFADPSLGGVLTSSGSTSILTLTYNTATMSDTDNLQIFLEVADNTEESILLLRRILKVLESSAIVDPRRRQKVVLDAIGTVVATGLPTEVTTTIPVSGTVTVGAITSPASTGTSVASGGQGPTASFPTLATTVYQPVWEGPVDQRWRVIEAARTSYAVGIRSNLVFENVS